MIKIRIKKTHYFLTFVILIIGVATYKYLKKYKEIEDKVQSIDENLITASTIALSTLPQLNYTFLIPERFIPLYQQLSETVDKLIMGGDDKLLKYKNGAKILLARGDLYFTSDCVDRAIDLWKKIYDHYNSPDDILRLAAFRLALGYNQLDKSEKARRFLNTANAEDRLKASILFLKYIWNKKIESVQKKYLNIEQRVKIRNAANHYFADDIPMWFVGTMYLVKENNYNLAIKSLSHFTRAIYDYLNGEMKNANYNLVVSWVASLLGLTIWYKQKCGINKLKEKDEYNFKNNESLLSVIKSLGNITNKKRSDIFSKGNKDLKLFWLSLQFDDSSETIEELGKFVTISEIEDFCTKALGILDKV